jgi:tetratricopeptide (TPR) repeat protein
MGGVSGARAVAGGLVVLLAVAIAPSEARAAPHDDAAAEALFLEGRKLMEEGRYDEACPKLLASHKASPGVGTLLNLGECYERAGKTASAWATFRDAIEAAQSAGRADREKLARTRADVLEPRLARVKIVANARAPGMTVKRDGAALDAAALGVALPVDPGKHQIEASAQGRSPFRAELVAIAGKTVVVEIPELARADEPAPRTAAPPPAAPPESPASSDGSTQRTIGWIGIGAGAVAIGVGAAFALNARAKWSDAQDNHCKGTVCDREGGALASDAKTSGNLATAFILGGAVVAGGGLALVLLAPTANGSATSGSRASIRVAPSLGGAALVAEGRL